MFIQQLLRIAIVCLLTFSAQSYSCVAATKEGGKEYYLDARTGSDNNNGSKGHPWRSLNRASRTTFHPRDTVSFARGSEFEGGFELKGSGTQNAPITLNAFGNGPMPRLSNPDTRILNGNAIRITGEYVIVDGLYFERCPANPVSADVRKLGAIFLTTNANHCIVRNCEMTQTPIGITVYGEHNLITKNYIHDNNAPIQRHWGPMCVVICSSHNEVSYNRFVNYSAPSEQYGHDGGAIEINDRALPKEDVEIHHNMSLRNQGFIEWVGMVKQDHFVIHHNVCMDYQAFLGLTGPCTNIRVDNNTVVRILAHEDDDSEDVIFWNYTMGGGNTNIVFRNNIFVYDPSRVEPIFSRGQFSHAHNLFFRTDRGNFGKQPNRFPYERKYLGGGVQLGVGDKIGDPLFRDMPGGNFRLKPGSPAIDAGMNLGYTRDFDDQAVPLGTAPDMGAFEFVPARD